MGAGTMPRVAAAALLVVAWFGVLGPLHGRQAGLRASLLDAAPADGGDAADGGQPVAASDASDDGISAVATASVSLPATDALMPLYATVDVVFGSALSGDVDVSVQYEPRHGSGKLPSLWTASETVGVSGDATAYSVRLFRVRANTEYVYRVYARPAGGVAAVAASGHFFSNPTGWQRFDHGAYAAVSGETPAVEVGAFAVYPSYSAHDQPKQWFQGLLGVDAEGFVVWMYSLYMLEAWDFLPDSTIALIARSDGSSSVLTDHGKGTAAKSTLGADGEVYEANSQLQKIGPDGELVSQFIQGCADGPLNFNKLSHECRVDKASAGLRVLTTEYAAMTVPNVSVPLKMGPTQTLVEHVDTFATTKVVSWDHEANTVEELYDLNDFFSPNSAGAFFETTAWNSVHMTCAGDSARNAIEFHHVSSISVGRDDNFLVSSRNLDTIWSLKRDGSGLQWTLSSHDAVGSDFSFERDLDKFYQPHAVVQLDNGNIVMMDDGTDRPGCTIMRTGQCFSRAIMYRLDRDAMVARVVWQFEAPDDVTGAYVSPADMESFSQKSAWNEVGGSVYRLENGHYLVAFSSVEADDENPKGAASIYELDTDGNRTTTSKIDIPTPLTNVGMQNGYRFTPWAAISGESSTNPLNATM